MVVKRVIWDLWGVVLPGWRCMPFTRVLYFQRLMGALVIVYLDNRVKTFPLL